MIQNTLFLPIDLWIKECFLRHQNIWAYLHPEISTIWPLWLQCSIWTLLEFYFFKNWTHSYHSLHGFRARASIVIFPTFSIFSHVSFLSVQRWVKVDLSIVCTQLRSSVQQSCPAGSVTGLLTLKKFQPVWKESK